MKEEQRWKRLRQLDKHLRKGGLHSQTEFAHHYDVDVRTIHNDLRWLEENAGPITPGKKLKQYINKECSSPFELTEEQTIAYLIGYTSIHQYGGSAFEQDAKELHNLLLTKIADPDIRDTLDSMSDAVKLRKGHITGDTERSAMHTLFTAFLNKQKVLVQHTKPGENTVERVLHPYTFVNEAGEWSIIAFCELKEQIQRFKINRLEELKLVDDCFVKDPEFEANDFLNKGFDNYCDGKSHRYRIQFDPQTTPHIAYTTKRNILHNILMEAVK